MKKYFALIVSTALVLSMTACGADTSGNTNNGAEGISAGLGEIGEKVGDLLGIESKEEKVLKNPLFKEGLLAVKVDGKWGYIDESGDFVIEPQFESAENFQSNGLAVVSSKVVDSDGNTSELYGFIDKSGSFTIKPQFIDANNFQPNGLAIVSSKVVDSDGYTKELYGLIDKNGNYIVEPAYWKIEDFQSNGLAVVGGTYSKNGEPYSGLGVIDEKGNHVIEPKYDKIEDFGSNGITKVAENMRDEILDPGSEFTTRVYDWGLINEKGEIILETKYSMISEFDKNGIAKVGVNPKIKKTYTSSYSWSEETIYNCGLVNEKGEFILEISPSNWGIGYFNWGWAKVDSFPYCNYVDKDGKFLIDYDNTKFGYDFLTDVDDFDFNGLARVSVGDYYVMGFIDTNGNCPVEIKYYDLGHYAKNGLTYAKRVTEKYGYIDEKGNYVIQPKFDKAEDFDDNGYARVNIGYEEDILDGVISEGKWGLIDESGNYVADPIYDEIVEIKYDVAVVRSDDKYGFINLEKNIIVEPEYKYLNFSSDRYIQCSSDLSLDWIYMDFDGNIESNVTDIIYVSDEDYNSYYIGFIDSQGNAQIDKQLLDSVKFINGVQILHCNGKYGVIDSDGNVNFVEDAYSIGRFSANSIAAAYKYDGENFLIGYINTNGDYIIEPQYSNATHFYDDNYTVVVKNNEYEIINENGENVFNQKFESIILNQSDWEYKYQ